MNKKKKFFVLLVLMLLLSYMSVLFVLVRFYPQERWIPKIILTLPFDVQKENDRQYGVKPDTQPTKKDEAPFNVLFDTVPLDAVDMVRPWHLEKNAVKTYSKTFVSSGLPKMSIVLTNVGLNDELFWNAIYKLSTSITLSFSPYSMDLPEKINAVRQNGFENMLDIVVQSENAYQNAGALGIKDGDSVQKIQQLIQNHYLDINVPFIGFWANKINQNNPEFKLVSDSFFDDYGLFTLNDADVYHVVEKDFFESAILKHLQEAQKNAKEKGASIIVFPMHPLVVEVLAEWMNMRFNPEVEFVPLSVIIKEDL